MFSYHNLINHNSSLYMSIDYCSHERQSGTYCIATKTHFILLIQYILTYKSNLVLAVPDPASNSLDIEYAVEEGANTAEVIEPSSDSMMVGSMKRKLRR